jgi:hypothetical protein
MAFTHCVFFTFKDGTPAGAIGAQVADAHELLGQIPTVRRVESGPRDETIAREVSMTDFGLGLLVLFDNRAGYDVYADHPLHLAYIDRHKANWAAVRVADFTAD